MAQKEEKRTAKTMIDGCKLKHNRKPSEPVIRAEKGSYTTEDVRKTEKRHDMEPITFVFVL